MSQDGPHNELLPTQAENEKMLYMVGREAVKAQLPMLYTTRGNLIKLDADKRTRISGKNLAELLETINILKGSSKELVLYMPDYNVHFSPVMSANMRAFGIIEDVILAGYNLTLDFS